MGHDYVNPRKFSLLQETIQEAKLIRATALANAKMAMDSSFSGLDRMSSQNNWISGTLKVRDENIDLESILKELEDGKSPQFYTHVPIVKAQPNPIVEKFEPDVPTKSKEYTLVGAKKVFKENS